MPKVMPPDIHQTDPQLAAPPLLGPKNLVERLEVELFDDFDNGPEGWSGEGALVLSFWTEDCRKSPIRFCLSPHAGQILLEEIHSALEGSSVG